MKKNILITGANGYLGSLVLARIPKKKYNIFALIQDKPIPRREGVKYLVADISDKDKLSRYKKIFKKIDILLHLAAYVPSLSFYASSQSQLDDLEKSIEINLKGTINLVNLMKGGGKLIFTNTCEIYRVFKDNIINENFYHQHRDVSFYAIGKLFAEKCLEILCQRKNIQFISLRFASIYGPGEKLQRVTSNFIKSAIKNKEIVIRGRGGEKRNYLYVEDAIGAIMKSIVCKKSGIFNIASPQALTTLDLAKLIKKIAGSKSKIVFRPKVRDKDDLVLDAKKAKKELKFKPVFKLAQGLKKEIAYFRKYND